MILYIHGFGSSGQGGKSSLFREYFKQHNIAFIAPSLSYVPFLAMSTLEELIETYEGEITLMGSSLGGYYSIYLAEKYGLKAVLINPAVQSARTLNRVIALNGHAKNYYDESFFEWNTSHIDMLKAYEVSSSTAEYLILVQKGDEVLDYTEVLDKIPQGQSIVEEGGSHAFDDISRHFARIHAFI
ncbi:MAG: YqiA/YcfP family alpha/beta fold hydrolase [Sulfurovum sp.]|nr:YqiA/YcfP family alpha/beta fold hydrolase [Sulfurovum sp.]